MRPPRNETRPEVTRAPPTGFPPREFDTKFYVIRKISWRMLFSYLIIMVRPTIFIAMQYIVANYVHACILLLSSCSFLQQARDLKVLEFHLLDVPDRLGPLEVPDRPSPPGPTDHDLLSVVRSWTVDVGSSAYM